MLLAEQLPVAAAVPLETEHGITGVFLLGRHTENMYLVEELERACQIVKELASALTA
ncbi:hypothetical protein D3C80_1964410 [compost metagenome]